jgi:hypothetical protein
VDGKLSLPSSPKPNLKAPPTIMHQPSLAEKSVKMNIQQPPKQMVQPQPLKQMEQPPAVAEKAETVNAKMIEDHLPAVKEHVSSTEVGFFRKFWRRLFGGKVDDSELKSENVLVESFGENLVKKNENTLAEHDRSGESPQKNFEKKSVDSTSQGDDPVDHTVETTRENKTATSSEPHAEILRKSPGLFNQILDWCNFGGDSAVASNDQPTVIHGHMKSDAGKPEVFSEDLFWREMESFIVMKRGSLVISQSRTRFMNFTCFIVLFL